MITLLGKRRQVEGPEECKGYDCKERVQIANRRIEWLFAEPTKRSPLDDSALRFEDCRGLLRDGSYIEEVVLYRDTENKKMLRMATVSTIPHIVKELSRQS